MLDRVVYMAPTNLEPSCNASMVDLMFVNDIQTEITRLSSAFKGFETFRVNMNKPLEGQLAFLERLETLDRYLLVIYTPVNINLSILNFQSAQANEVVQQIKKDMRFRLYT